MDPFTQAILGGGSATAFANKKDIRFATFCGMIGGLVPDLDILIRSSEDTLLFIEYHRHFSHSIFFAPVGSLIVSIFIYLLFIKKKKSFKKIYFFSILGFLTHGLLDSFTSYGTMLFWPFSEERVAYNIISIIDPLFTIPLLIFLIASNVYKSNLFTRIGLLVCCFYLSMGLFINKKVETFVYQIAKNRGHKISRILLNPTFGNIILWRTIYKSDKYYYVDAVYTPFFKRPKIKKGLKVNVINKDTVFPSIKANTKQRKDINRFSKFSNDFIYIHPNFDNIIADLRYGTLPYDSLSMWGIMVKPEEQDQHVEFKNLRDFKKEHYKIFLNMLKGELENTYTKEN